MKILFLNNFYYLRGGSERVLFEEMRMLREAGHEVAVYARRHEKNEPAEFSELFPAPMDTERLKISPQALRMAGELIYSWPARLGLREVLERFRPDIAHAHNIYGRLSTSVLDLLKKSRIPTVLTLHDLKLLCPSYLMLNHDSICERCKGGRFYHAVLTKCHKDSYPASFVYAFETWFNVFFRKYDSVRYFIAPSRFLRDKAVEYGWDAEKIVHIPNFIDGQRLTSSTHAGGYSLFLGRLSMEKGVRTLLLALKNLPVQTYLVVAGTGPEREALRELAAENALPATFPGHLNGKELEKVISGAKVVIIPSEWYENAPLSVLEAFSYGKPVIGARIGGIPEMIEEGVNGFLFEPGNAADLQDKWTRFLQLPAERTYAMGRNAKDKVEREYGASSHYERLMEVYHRAMGAARPAGQ